ncbi:MAG: Gfo/Idh/MocA family protein [Alphaproteobacteria bacterium]
MMNIAVVGLGWWGRHVVGLLHGNQKLRVVAGVDVDPASARDFATENGIVLSDDYQAVLDDPAIDGVVLVTPHSTHEALVLQAARAGKQVFCEKPLSLTATSARKMVKACAAKGIVLGIGHERRFETAMEKLAGMISRGELGTIMSVEGNYSYEMAGTFATGDWRASTAEAPAAGWTGTGVHMTDLLISMLGPVREVRAVTGQRVLDRANGDLVSVQFTFVGGAVGTINVVSATPFYARLAVFGNKGWVDIHETAHAATPGESHMYIGTPGGKRERRIYKPTNIVRRNLEAWADAVAGKSEYRFTDEQKVANVAFMEALVRSAASGKPERVRN